MNHTPVIDYYTSQYNLMMEGNVYYCVRDNEYVILKTGPVSCMADRPEKACLFRNSSDGSVICIANGHERKTGVTNVVEMTIKTDKLSKNMMGFHYLRMETDWTNQMVNVKISEVEEMISTSCLLLPVVIEVGPTKQCLYAVVRDD